MNFISEVFKLYLDRWDFFSKLIIQHITLTLISVTIITILGLLIGIFMTMHKAFASIILGLTNFLYTIPSIAMFGFLVAITGIGNKSAIIALVAYGLLPMIRNTFTGIMEVDNEIVESAIAMGSRRSQLLFFIQLPLALPVMLAGFRTMVVMTIALGGIASFIGAGGLGVAIWRGITTNYMEMTVAGSLLVAMLAIIADYLLELIERWSNKKILGRKKSGGFTYV